VRTYCSFDIFVRSKMICILYYHTFLILIQNLKNDFSKLNFTTNFLPTLPDTTL
jgi:hypothetical protein